MESIKQKDRSQEEYLNLTRSEAQNHYRTEASKAEKKEASKAEKREAKKYTFVNKVGDFFESKFFSWVYHYFKSRFGANHKFQSYTVFGTDKGVYKLEKTSTEGRNGISIALASDWATDTIESDKIGELIGNYSADYTIHLGDTYFVGMKDEIKDNFISENCSWPKGSSGSFSLLGNHEMYSRGISYFRDLLPTLGIYSGKEKKYLGQRASFFALENEYWRVIGLDTGYNSVGPPIIEFIFPPKCDFKNEILSWLKTTLDLRNDKRGIVLLTHHQYCSAFEKDYVKPAEQVAEIIGTGRKVLWFWGHEHRLAVYGRYKSKNGITAYGRCIGHGAMPVEFKEKVKDDKAASCNLILYDERVNTEIKDSKIGYNGFVIMNIDGPELKTDYFDINNELLLREIWVSDIQTGDIKGKEIKLYADDISVYSNDINKAIS